MSFPKPKFAVWLEFVFRERLYFLVFLLGLTALLLSEPSAALTNSYLSPAVEQFQQAARAWEQAPFEWDNWLQAFLKNPAAVVAALGFMAIFSVLFFTGMILWLWAAVMPRFRGWFFAQRVWHENKEWKPVIFFRVFVLTFTGAVISGFLIGSCAGKTGGNENAIGLLHTLLVDGLACFSVFAVLKFEKIDWNLLRAPQWGYGREIGRGFVTYVAVFPIFISGLLIAAGVSEFLNYEPPLHPLAKIFTEEESRSPLIFQFAFILATMVAPFLEEIFFRGFCYRIFRGWWGANGAAGISAALFAGIHGSGFAFFPIFILGFALAWLYEKRGHLTACWTFHVLHNILFTGYFFAVKAILGVMK